MAVGLEVAVSVGRGVAVAVAGFWAICPLQAVSRPNAATHKINLSPITYSVSSADWPDSSGWSVQPTFQMRERRPLSGLRAPV